MATIIVTESFLRPWVPRYVALWMITCSIFGVIFVLSAASSLHIFSIASFWLHETSYSADVKIRIRTRRAIICAALELICIPVVVFLCFSIQIRTGNGSPSTPLILALFWLAFTSPFSLIASSVNLCWGIYNLHKWKSLEEFEGSASKEGDYRALRAEQLGLLVSDSAHSAPEFASS
jgi:hypothetical protein